MVLPLDLRRHGPCPPLDFGLLDLRAVRGINQFLQALQFGVEPGFESGVSATKPHFSITLLPKGDPRITVPCPFLVGGRSRDRLVSLCSCCGLRAGVCLLTQLACPACQLHYNPFYT